MTSSAEPGTELRLHFLERVYSPALTIDLHFRLQAFLCGCR